MCSGKTCLPGPLSCSWVVWELPMKYSPFHYYNPCFHCITQPSKLMSLPESMKGKTTHCDRTQAICYAHFSLLFGWRKTQPMYSSKKSELLIFVPQKVISTYLHMYINNTAKTIPHEVHEDSPERNTPGSQYLDQTPTHLGLLTSDWSAVKSIWSDQPQEMLESWFKPGHYDSICLKCFKRVQGDILQWETCLLLWQIRVFIKEHISFTTQGE